MGHSLSPFRWRSRSGPSCWCRHGRGRQPVLIPCAAFAIGGFVGCLPRPDASHIAFCAPLALPLIAHGHDRVVGTWSPRGQAGVAALALLAMAPAGVDYARVAKHALLTPAAETPAGAGAFAEPDTGAIVGRVAALPKTDGVFFYPIWRSCRYWRIGSTSQAWIFSCRAIRRRSSTKRRAGRWRPGLDGLYTTASGPIGCS